MYYDIYHVYILFVAFFFPKQIDEIVSATQNISVDINSWVLLWGKKFQFQSRTKKLFQSFQHQCQAPIAYDWSVMLRTLIKIIWLNVRD